MLMARTCVHDEAKRLATFFYRIRNKEAMKLRVIYGAPGFSRVLLPVKMSLDSFFGSRKHHGLTLGTFQPNWKNGVDGYWRRLVRIG